MFGDTDSISIMVALEKKGHSVTRWIGDNYPILETSSFYFSNQSTPFGEISGQNLHILSEDADVLWLRRPRWPVLPNYIHTDDLKLAKQETTHYIRSFYQASWRNAVWVNDANGRRQANSKLLQLKLAVELGLKIPSTIVSNNPVHVRKFIDQNIQGTIIKPLAGGEFKSINGRRVTYTAKISELQLPSDEMIRACPAIYQEQIKKRSEARVTFFGAEAISLEIESQLSEVTKIDWRIGDARNLEFKNIELPPDVYEKCVELMGRLGIVHGSFDFAIDENDAWIFFEVNESGQFLWLESALPSLPVIEIAAQFLSAPKKDFRWDKTTNKLNLDAIQMADRYLELAQSDQENLKKARNDVG
jgi:glutathione synthase/RimK-type ligase-like ATP-grasp enzyme